MLNIKDIAWATGFLEGEGYFASVKNCAHIEAAQVEYEPIEKLQKLFGGWVKYTKHKLVKGNFYYRWGLYGKNAIGLMMTIYDLMSPKRQKKIKEIIGLWKSAPGKGNFQHRSQPIEVR